MATDSAVADDTTDETSTDQGYSSENPFAPKQYDPKNPFAPSKKKRAPTDEEIKAIEAEARGQKPDDTRQKMLDQVAIQGQKQNEEKIAQLPPVAARSRGSFSVKRADEAQFAPAAAAEKALEGRTDFPSRVGRAVAGMVARPIQTAGAIATAPVKALATGAEKMGQTAAEMSLPPDIAQRAFEDPERISDFDAALSAAQLASTLPSLLSGTAQMVGKRLAWPIGSGPAGVVGGAAAAAIPGAAYSPDDPAVGAAIAAGMGGVGAGVEGFRPRSARPRFPEPPPPQLDNILPRRPGATATATMVDEPPAPRAPAGPSETIDETLARVAQERGLPASRQLAAGPMAGTRPTELEAALDRAQGIASPEPPDISPAPPQQYSGIIAPREGPMMSRAMIEALEAKRAQSPTPAATPAIEPTAALDFRAGIGKDAIDREGKKVNPQPLPEAEKAAGTEGKETRVLLRDGQVLPAQYKVMSLDDLKPSHDPFSFQPTQGYPEGVQGRDYQRNVGAQQTVRLRALTYDPNIALNPSESAGEGPPTVLPNGTVLAGNERSMLPKIAAVNAPEKYAAYAAALKKRAATYGLDPQEIEGIKNPVLVRQLTHPTDVQGGPKRWGEINQLSDETGTKAKSSVEEGAARSAKLSSAPDALAHFADTIGPDETISDYLDGAPGRQFVKKLRDEGVFTPEEFGRISDGKGGLTEDGRSAVRRMMLGAAVPDPAALSDAPASAIQKLEHAVPAIVSARGSEFDVADHVAGALKILAEAKAKGVTLTDLKDQTVMFGEKPDPKAQAMAEFLDSHKKGEVKGAFMRYGVLAREAVSNAGSVDMFGGTGYTPDSAFKESFQTPLNEQKKVAGKTGMVGEGGRRRSPKSSELSLFAGKDLFGGAGTMGETDVGAGKKPMPQNEAPKAEMGGAISPEEMAARRDELGAPKSEAEQTATRDQGTLFGEGGRRRARPEKQQEQVDDEERETARASKLKPEEKTGKHPSPDPTGLSSGKAKFRPGEILQALKALINPTSFGAEAEATGGNIGEAWARSFRSTAQAKAALAKGKDMIDALPRERQIELWDAAEHGRSSGDPDFDQLARLVHNVTQKRTDALIQLGRLRAENAITDYIGRFWSKPTSKRGFDFMTGIKSRISLEGSKSFLKERSILDFTDGLDAGLIPATYNYIEAQLAKLEEMDHLIAGQLALNAEQAMGRAVPVMDADGYSPPNDADGDPYVRIGQEKDPAVTIYGPNRAVHEQAWDAQKKEGLLAVIETLSKMAPLDYEHALKPKLHGQTMNPRWWGAASQSGQAMATRFGADIGTVVHELGHILDFRYGLWDALRDPPPSKETVELKRGKRKGETITRNKKEDRAAVESRKKIEKELRDLADQREKDIEKVTESRKRYLRDRYEKMANALDALISAPELMEKYAPTVKQRLTKFLKDRPELAPLLDIKPGVRRSEAQDTEKLRGVQIVGHYYAPKGSAAVWNAHLSKGLAGNALYDAYMAPLQAAQQMMLGLTGFHGTVIATEGMFSDLAVGIDRLVEGEASGLKDLAGAPAAAVKLAQLGSQVMREYLEKGSRPDLAPVLDAMIKGGYRGTAKSEMWTGERKEKLKKAVREAIQSESKGRRLWGAARIPFDAIWAGIEMASGPLMGKYVPLMKTGATYMAVARELEKLPKDANADQIHAIMRDVNKEMDFRFGQVTYDNFFINRTVKHIAQAVFLAPGWTVGTATLMARGVKQAAQFPSRLKRRITGEKPPRVGPEPRPDGKDDPGAEIPEPLVGKSAAYWIGAVAGTMFINGLLTKLLTGENPSGKDFWAFRDGSLDTDGNANRHVIPGYLMHDVYGWTHHPINTFVNKLAPTLAFIERFAENRDYFGNDIYDPDAPLFEKTKETATAVRKQFQPLSISNFDESKRRGESGAGQFAQNFMGVTPAKKEFTRTPAQNMIARFLGDRMPQGRTPTEVQSTDARRMAIAKARQGDATDLTRLEKEGGISRPQLKSAMRNIGKDRLGSSFGKLTLEQMKKVMDGELTPEEKQTFTPIFARKKIRAARQSFAPTEP